MAEVRLDGRAQPLPGLRRLAGRGVPGGHLPVCGRGRLVVAALAQVVRPADWRGRNVNSELAVEDARRRGAWRPPDVLESTDDTGRTNRVFVVLNWPCYGDLVDMVIWGKLY